MAVRPAVSKTSALSFPDDDPSPAAWIVRTLCDSDFVRCGRPRTPVDPKRGVDAVAAVQRAAKDDSAARVYRGGDSQLGRDPDSDAPGGLRNLDTAANQQSLPGQSLRSSAGTEPPLSLRREN